VKFTQQNVACIPTTEFHPVQGEIWKCGFTEYSISGVSNTKSHSILKQANTQDCEAKVKQQWLMLFYGFVFELLAES